MRLVAECGSNINLLAIGKHWPGAILPTESRSVKKYYRCRMYCVWFIELRAIYGCPLSAWWSFSSVKLHATEVGLIFPAISQIFPRTGQHLITYFPHFRWCDQNEHISFYPVKSNHYPYLDQIDYREPVLIIAKTIPCISTISGSRATDWNIAMILNVAPVPALCTRGPDGACWITVTSGINNSLRWAAIEDLRIRRIHVCITQEEVNK
jgi:hypothetical protein